MSPIRLTTAAAGWVKKGLFWLALCVVVALRFADAEPLPTFRNAFFDFAQRLLPAEVDPRLPAIALVDIDGASLAEADLSETDLTDARGLSRQQLDTARRDSRARGLSEDLKDRRSGEERRKENRGIWNAPVLRRIFDRRKGEERRNREIPRTG